jgi:hypothetical protein
MMNSIFVLNMVLVWRWYGVGMEKITAWRAVVTVSHKFYFPGGKYAHAYQ